MNVAESDINMTDFYNELPSLAKPYTAISLASKADANHKNRWIEANAITLRFGGELLAYFAKRRMIPELQSIIAVLYDECRANGVDDLLQTFVNVIADEYGLPEIRI